MKRRKRKRLRPNAAPEASYICGACGEEIVIPLDLSAGSEQSYVEDCPVCCRPNVINIDILDAEDIRVHSEFEYES